MQRIDNRLSNVVSFFIFDAKYFVDAGIVSWGQRNNRLIAYVSFIFLACKFLVKWSVGIIMFGS